MHQQSQPQDLLFAPADVARIGIANLDYRRKNKGMAIPFGIPSVDKDYLPLLPGELETIIGRPGNGKTGVMIQRARKRAEYLAAKGERRAVVYATCEQTVEELYAFGVAAETGINISSMARGEINNGEWAKIELATMTQGAMPLWLIGPSKEKRRKRPRITVSAVVDTLFYMEDSAGIKADILFLDYLQLVKFEGRAESKTIGTAEVLEACKDGALHTDCPWVVGVQARREVDVQQLQIPGLDSGQWTSGIEQFSDKVWSVTRPSKYRKSGEMFGSMEVKGTSQMLLSLLKQKLGVDNKAYWVYFDPAYNKLHELENRYALPDQE